MKSMTGYAKRQCTAADRKYTVEIKTLNSKTLDIIAKLPASLRSRELDIRTLLNPLERGKIDLVITEEVGTATAAQINTDLVLQRYSQLQQLAQQLDQPTTNLLDSFLRIPDVWETTDNTDLADSEWQTIAGVIADTVADLDRFRQQEGDILKKDFIKHVDLIEQKLNSIPQYEAERIDTAKERIHRYFSEAAIKEIDPNRFEQELIYYLEKLDITEEKIRLAKHIDYFRHTMDHEENCGKKLGFVAQEMGREINTTGSKANHVEIQKIVVGMKDELEKIKEQLGNIL
jgi:uncharacterized protein (TIGR00255 family)